MDPLSFQDPLTDVDGLDPQGPKCQEYLQNVKVVLEESITAAKKLLSLKLTMSGTQPAGTQPAGAEMEPVVLSENGMQQFRRIFVQLEGHTRHIFVCVNQRAIVVAMIGSTTCEDLESLARLYNQTMEIHGPDMLAELEIHQRNIRSGESGEISLMPHPPRLRAEQMRPG